MTEDPPIVTFSTRRSVGEIWRVYVKASFFRWEYALFSAFIAGGSALLFVTGHPLAIGLASIAIASYFIIPVLACVSIHRSLSGNPAVVADTSVAICEWGVRMTSSHHSQSLTWDVLDSVHESPGHLHVFLAPRQLGLVWPKRDISPEQLALLNTVLAQHLRPAK
jgi:hypothetical protein